MGLSLKKIVKGAGKVLKRANPISGFALDVVRGKSAKDAAKTAVGSMTANAKLAAPLLAAGLAAPALAGMAGAGGAAGAAGAAGTAGAASGAGGAAAAAAPSLTSKLLGAFNSPLGGAVVDLAGNVMGGIAQGKMRDQDRGEERRQFDMTFGLQKGKDDREAALFNARRAGLQATTPMREQLMARISQRLGLPMPPTGAPATPSDELRRRAMSRVGM
jgi:hypothetical protein